MSYVEERYNIIKQFEGAYLQPYVDDKGLITIKRGQYYSFVA